MKKMIAFCMVLILCMCLAACGPDGSSGNLCLQTPGKISDVIPYRDTEAEVYCRIDTVGERFVKLAYSEEQTEEIADLLDSIDLHALAVTEDRNAAETSGVQYLCLLILCGTEEYKLDICGTDNIYLNLYENGTLTHSWTGEQGVLLVNELAAVDQKVREYSHDVSDFMVVSERNVGGYSVNRAVSLWMEDVMRVSLEESEPYDGAEADFNVSMRLKESVYYLNTETRTAAVMTSSGLKAAAMEEEIFLSVMRKISGKLMLEERIAAEVKAVWDAWILEEELEKKTPYPMMQRYRDVALSQWSTEESALLTAEKAWIMMEACRWYAEKEGYLPEDTVLERHLADTAGAFLHVDAYAAACSALDISVEDWVRADWRNQEFSLITTEIFMREEIPAEELASFIYQITEEYTSTDVYAAAEPAVKRSLELLTSGQELTADRLRSEDIFIE